MKDIHITGRYTFEDYLEGHKAAAATRRIVLKVVMTIAGVLMLVQSSWFERLSGVLILMYVVVISGVIFRWLVQRQWDRHPSIRKKEMNLRFFADGVESRDDEGKPVLMKWDRFTHWKDSSRIILVYMSPHLWLMVPKRALTDKQLVRLREVLSEHIS